jgi:hypothetical protein
MSKCLWRCGFWYARARRAVSLFLLQVRLLSAWYFPDLIANSLPYTVVFVQDECLLKCLPF